jgi:hypothetical protein
MKLNSFQIAHSGDVVRVRIRIHIRIGAEGNFLQVGLGGKGQSAIVRK